MEEIDAVKARLKERRGHFKTSKNKIARAKYVNGLIARSLISIIVFFLTVIAANFNVKAEEFIKTDILKDNMSFTKISNLYNKYFGHIVPIKEIKTDTKTVFKENLSYTEMKDYKDGYELTVTSNYLVPIIHSGIVVFIGEKDDYGNTVIIQGIDEVDYWYGNVDNLNVGLYDYVQEGSMLGSAVGNKMYLVFQKSGEYLGYDEIME